MTPTMMCSMGYFLLSAPETIIATFSAPRLPNRNAAISAIHSPTLPLMAGVEPSPSIVSQTTTFAM
jgi:hypothetical protein